MHSIHPVWFEVAYSGKNASAMNWAGWSQDAIDETMNVALRMMDDPLFSDAWVVSRM